MNHPEQYTEGTTLVYGYGDGRGRNPYGVVYAAGCWSGRGGDRSKSDGYGDGWGWGNGLGYGVGHGEVPPDDGDGSWTDFATPAPNS